MSSFEQMIAIQKSIDRYLSSIKMPTASIMEAIQRNNRLVERALLPQLNMLQEVETINKAIAGSLVIPNRIIEEMKAQQNLLPNYLEAFSAANAVLESFRIAELKIPNYISKINYDLTSIFNTSRYMSEAYNALLTSVSEITIIPAYTNNFITKPIISTASHFTVLKWTRLIETDDNETLEADLIEAIDSDWKESESRISKIEPEWLILLSGAEAASLSNNPDRVRHAITSLRELITQIIKHLAPDKEVKSFLSEEKWYHDGHPTRKARLYYILTKRYNNDVLLDFIDKDITAILAIFDLFQRGTHEIVSSIDPSQLKFILRRTKALVCQLIQ